MTSRKHTVTKRKSSKAPVKTRASIKKSAAAKNFLQEEEQEVVVLRRAEAGKKQVV